MRLTCESSKVLLDMFPHLSLRANWSFVGQTIFDVDPETDTIVMFALVMRAPNGTTPGRQDSCAGAAVALTTGAAVRIAARARNRGLSRPVCKDARRERFR